MNYTYQSFGFTISSEIQFKELYAIQPGSPVDISIKVGKCPRRLSGKNVLDRVVFQASEDEFLFSLKGVAHYYIHNGKKVIIEPHQDASWESIRVVFLTSVLAAMMPYSGCIPMRSSVIKHGNKVVLLCGITSVGKSTIAAQLRQRGYDLFSDEFCVIKKSKQDKLACFAAFPVIYLWQQALDQLDRNYFAYVKRARVDIEKYACSFQDQFDPNAASIDQIVYVREKDDPEFIQHLEAHDKLRLLENSTAFLDLVNHLGERSAYFKMMMSVIQECSMYVVNRPTSSEDLVKFIDKLEDVLNS